MNTKEWDKIEKHLEKKGVKKDYIKTIGDLVGAANSWDRMVQTEKKLIARDRNFALITERIRGHYSKNQWFGHAAQFSGAIRASLKMLEYKDVEPRDIDEELRYEWEDL